MTQVVIGTAGHIDHGKTTLVKALTGTDTDRLREEKERGMTIDLGFAFLTENITIIDVPGHEKFIRNMVAGVSTVQIALVTIAADDGIMPQTREHIDILNLLGCKLGCIALTKIDLIRDPEWIELIESDIKDYVKRTFLEKAPFVKVSGETGEGIEELKSTLINLANEAEEMDDRGFFRLYVDRAFTMKGFGTVATGTVVSGSLSTGDRVEIVPSGKVVKVRGLQSHGISVEKVRIGDRAAVNLAGLEKRLLKRGSQLSEPGYLTPVTRLGTEIFLLPTTKKTIKNEQRVRIHVGTEEVMGRVYLASMKRKKKINPGGKLTALIRLEKKVAAAVNDPIIIRFYSPSETIGGGKILDIQPPKHWAECQKWLSSLNNLDEKAIREKYINSSLNYPKRVSEWSKRWQISPDKISLFLDELDVIYLGPPIDPLVTFQSSLSYQINEYINRVNRFHDKKQWSKGIGLDDLRQQLDFSEDLFSYITQRLESEKEITLSDGIVRRFGFKIELKGERKILAEKVMRLFKDSNFIPISSPELGSILSIPEKEILEIVHILKNEDKIVEVNRALWLDAKNFEFLKQKVKQFFKTQSSMTVNDFKELTKTTRKHAIPMLEFLDEQQITSREGNIRITG